MSNHSDIMLEQIQGIGKGIDKFKGDLSAIGERVSQLEVKSTELKDVDERVLFLEKNQAKTAINATTSTFENRLASEIEKKTDDFIRLGKGEKNARVEIELKAADVVTTGNVTGGNAWGAQMRNGIIENPLMGAHVRDIMNVLKSGPGTDYYFMRENGNGEGNPAPHAEGTTKSQFDVDLVEASVKFETIAGFMPISRKAMNNIPGMISFVQKNALKRLYQVEDNQILYGDGNTPNLKGILTSGNFVASTSASTVLVEKILDDIATLEDQYNRQATGIAVRPIQYWSFFKNKASGSGEYDLPMGFSISGNQLYLWGIPVIKLPALATNAGSPTTNDYIVGDFTNGADIMEQESIRIEFFEQDSDNVRKNLITMRIEETIALPVYTSNSFIRGRV
ncbi:phage major capsid protein [Niabella sp. 22666]|uniref:phage major capsid protein n=1 Tax=Niabella sp. 22666 TaxID=3453954 RepID=UPI003F86EA73